MFFLLLSACFARRHHRHRRNPAANADFEDFMTEGKLADMIRDRISAGEREKELERLVTAKIEAAMPEQELIRVPRRHGRSRRFWPQARSGFAPRTPNFSTQSGRVRGRRYTYENYPGLLIKPEQIFFPGVTDVMGPIASARKIAPCLSSAPSRERVMKLGSATGMFPQNFD